jgi:hypothetical protein
MDSAGAASGAAGGDGVFKMFSDQRTIPSTTDDGRITHLAGHFPLPRRESRGQARRARAARRPRRPKSRGPRIARAREVPDSLARDISQSHACAPRWTRAVT